VLPKQLREEDLTIPLCSRNSQWGKNNSHRYDAEIKRSSSIPYQFHLGFLYWVIAEEEKGERGKKECINILRKICIVVFLIH